MNPSIALLQQMIQNKCINTGEIDSGNEIKSALTLQNFFKSYGLESEIFESHLGRANLLLKVSGKNPKAPSIMYMGHMDVVPANADEWDYDPFGGEIIKNHICGRGAIDMLNMTSSMAAGIAEYWKNNGTPEGDLLFLAVADEEAAGRLGASYMIENHWDKVRCDYMIAELGGFFLPENKTRTITVTVGEKGVSRFRLTTSGLSAHGSMPYKSDNALTKIAEAAYLLGQGEYIFQVTDQYNEMVLSLIEDADLQNLLLNEETVKEGLSKIDDFGLARFIHAAGRMTVSPTIIKSGNKDNVIPDHGELTIDVRSLPGQTVDDIITELRKKLGTISDEVKIEATEYFSSDTSSLNTPMYRTIDTMIKNNYAGSKTAPMFISSVSDGRFWRARGCEVYGFCMFDPEMTMENYSSMLHGKNERITIASMDRAFDFFRDLPDVFYNKIKRR